MVDRVTTDSTNEATTNTYCRPHNFFNSTYDFLPATKKKSSYPPAPVPEPVPHPLTHPSPPYASHSPPQLYPPLRQSDATPQSGGSPTVREIGAQDVKVGDGVGNNSQKRRTEEEVEVDDTRYEQREEGRDLYLDHQLHIRQQILSTYAVGQTRPDVS